MYNSHYHLSTAVQDALTTHKPVLALESTVITHGLPYPQNVETALSLEAQAKELGVTPATIAVLDGRIHIGLNEAEMTHLGNLSREHQEGTFDLRKIAKRDIPLAVAKSQCGGTTVSATLALAYAAGIKVFATGGIGGMHRYWQETYDISADIQALGSYPLIVITAGCKAILDIPATLEALEALSVPVYGWHTDRCPAFYTRESDIPVERLDNLHIVANTFRAHLDLNKNMNVPLSSLLIMNPIPMEYSLPHSEIEPHIERAIHEAKQKGISGKALTPWLLSRLAEITAGHSVAANKALLHNNVQLGCKILLELARKQHTLYE